LAITGDISEVLFDADAIAAKVEYLSSHISHDYQGKELVLVSVLKGGLMFLADLARGIDMPLSMDFMAISSYGAATEQTGVVQVIKDLSAPILGKDVLVVEDIIDTGLTLNYLLSTLRARQPLSVSVCTLMDKSVRRIVDMPLKYKGFDVPDLFLVGYGLDYQQKYRNLPFVGVLKEGVFGR